MENIQELWVDKYAPKCLDDYVLDAELKKDFKHKIQSRSLQSFTLLGTQGSGKTTLAKVLANELDAEVLFVRCATEGTIDVLRTKVANFCNACSLEGKIKLVILDEIDSASQSSENSFQKGLRTLIEQAQSDTRFILTANYQKVIPAVLSRCPIVPLYFSQKDLLVHLKRILDNENIQYTKDTLKQFIDQTFKYYPDCRRIVNYLQFCSSSGSLSANLDSIADKDKYDLMQQLVKLARESKQLLDVRKHYVANKQKINDFGVLGSDLYNYVIDNDLVTDDGVLVLTEQLFQLSQIVDKESYVFGMFATARKYAK